VDAPGRRIKVSTDTIVRLNGTEVPVTVVGLSARDALILCQQSLGTSGGTLDLVLPTVGKRAIEVMVGIGRADRIEQGYAIIVEFMIVEQKLRSALNDLLRLLLAGDGGGARRHPRIIYDVPVRHGPLGSMQARLEEISLSGLSLCTPDRMLPGTEITIVVPDYASDSNLTLSGQVVQQRMAKEGGYHTGIALTEITNEARGQLARLLADLLCR
jgi:hypothetical protein